MSSEGSLQGKQPDPPFISNTVCSGQRRDFWRGRCVRVQVMPGCRSLCMCDTEYSRPGSELVAPCPTLL